MKWLLIPLFAIALPTAGQINSVPILDNSDSTAIQIKGEAMFAESIESSARCADLHEPRCLVVSILDQFSCRNASGRPILAFVATIHYASSYGNGLEDYTLVDIRLFDEHLFEPEDVYSPPPNAHGTMILPFRAAEQTGLPKAEVKTVFAQFADGTTSGDVKVGEQLRRMLKEEWQVLSNLDQIYALQGGQEFMSSLKNAKLPFEFGLGRGIENDPIAIERIHATVVRAKERLARINVETSVKSP